MFYCEIHFQGCFFLSRKCEKSQSVAQKHFTKSAMYIIVAFYTNWLKPGKIFMYFSIAVVLLWNEGEEQITYSSSSKQTSYFCLYGPSWRHQVVIETHRVLWGNSKRKHWYRPSFSSSFSSPLGFAPFTAGPFSFSDQLKFSDRPTLTKRTVTI